MKEVKTPDKSEILRLLPSIDALLRSEIGNRILLVAGGGKQATVLARAAIDSLRAEIEKNIAENSSKTIDYTKEDLLKEAETRLAAADENERKSGLQAVINATGVIVHTNLGRAPLSEKARRALIEKASGYCNLEYNLATGKRGKRGARAENLLAEVTGAEAALIVNNCAAAAFLVLNVLARGGEVIISRGELVEIGGDFRVPDVMEQSGAVLKEVGTTNRTKLADFERAINEATRLILKVHPSNYRIIGFTAAPSLSELAEVARGNDILLYEDAGSGALFDLSADGLDDEPVINESIKAGADVVTFSGDKLFGGVQSGLIVGRMEIIEKLRKHPLYRALRVDKLIYAALEATLESFRRGAARSEIPVLRMLSANEAEIKERTKKFAGKLKRKTIDNRFLSFEIVAGNSVIGGGSAPLARPATALLGLKHAHLSATNLEQSLRMSEPPVIARIWEDRVLLDLRTVSEKEETQLLDILANI